MKREDLRHYLPTLETYRRVMDRARSEANLRRAAQTVQFLPISGKEAGQGAVGGAAPAPAPAEGKPERRRWPWWVTAGAALSPVVPAVLVYWLLVPHGTREGAEAPREVPPTLEMVIAGSAAAAAAGAPAPSSAAPAASSAAPAASSAAPAAPSVVPAQPSARPLGEAPRAPGAGAQPPLPPSKPPAPAAPPASAATPAERPTATPDPYSRPNYD